MKMENNWIDKIELILLNGKSEDEYFDDDNCELLLSFTTYTDLVDKMIEFGNLVFEATKREAADKAELIDNGYTDELPNGNMHYFERLTLDKDSILSINKPNL